jgi:hypothetical protein
MPRERIRLYNVERLIPSYVERRLRRTTREALLDMPAVLAFPERGVRPVHRASAGGNYRLQMQWSLSRGDTTNLRRQLGELREIREDIRPGQVAFDGTYHEARLLLSLGDSSEATRLLDLSLNALPTLGTYLLDQVPQSATLVRGMALRADLAMAAGDTAVARRWAHNVVVLWNQSDKELERAVKRMRWVAGERADG